MSEWILNQEITQLSFNLKKIVNHFRRLVGKTFPALPRRPDSMRYSDQQWLPDSSNLLAVQVLRVEHTTRRLAISCLLYPQRCVSGVIVYITFEFRADMTALLLTESNLLINHQPAIIRSLQNRLYTIRQFNKINSKNPFGSFHLHLTTGHPVFRTSVILSTDQVKFMQQPSNLSHAMLSSIDFVAGAWAGCFPIIENALPGVMRLNEVIAESQRLINGRIQASKTSELQTMKLLIDDSKIAHPIMEEPAFRLLKSLKSPYDPSRMNDRNLKRQQNASQDQQEIIRNYSSQYGVQRKNFNNTQLQNIQMFMEGNQRFVRESLKHQVNRREGCSLLQEFEIPNPSSVQWRIISETELHRLSVSTLHVKWVSPRQEIEFGNKPRVIVKKEASPVQNRIYQTSRNYSNCRISRQSEIVSEFRHVPPIYFTQYFYSQQPQLRGQALFMDFVQGVNLNRLLQQNETVTSLNTKLYIAWRALYALRALRDYRVVHMDFKPTNVMVQSHYLIKLIDFGESFSPQQTYNSAPAFSIPYAAPELMSKWSSNSFDEKQDVYSFGVLLKNLVFGNSNSSTIQTVSKNIVAEDCGNYGPGELVSLLVQLISRCMDAKPQARPLLDWLALILHSINNYLLRYY